MSFLPISMKRPKGATSSQEHRKALEICVSQRGQGMVSRTVYTYIAGERVENNIHSVATSHSSNAFCKTQVSTGEDVVFQDAAFLHEQLKSSQ